METIMTPDNVKEAVQQKYGAAARRVRSGQKGGCCGGDATACGGGDPITRNLYGDGEASLVPEEAVLASLGCGNPTALAELNPGEVVLDLGSGGGIDVLLSARRVGPGGKAYGLDMTGDMLALARENQRKAGVENVEFLKGEIENIPLPDNSVDVIISNCVINLSADKDRVMAEAFRVLKPGGRFAVSDVVVRGEAPAEVRRNIELWIGCVAGALEETEYQTKLALAGFTSISLEPTRVYRAEDAREFLVESGLDPESVSAEIDGKFASMFVRAQKPAKALAAAVRVEVFDAPACCAEGGECGPLPSPVLPRFAADLEWLAAQQGVTVERHQAPAAGGGGPETGPLPLIKVNGAAVSRGRYPERPELARFAGLAVEEPPVALPVVGNASADKGCC